MLYLLRILKKSLLFTLLNFVIFNIAKGQVAGKVFKDLNSNGVQNLPNEIGLSSYVVHAYLPNSNAPIVTLTNSAGQFYYTSVEIPSGTKVRIEFPDLNNQKEAILGTDNKSSVQFLTAGIGAFASIGILNSVDFCNLGGLEILTPCYVNGDPMVPGGSAGQDVALVKFPFNASGLAGSSGSPYPSMLASTADIGAVWGTAYQRRGNVFLMSALIRRHSGLGSLGSGGIYKYDNITNAVSPFIDVKTLGIETGPDPHTTLTGDKLTPNTDPNTIPFTGKSGIGSITLSGDEKDLFMMNLYDRKIYSFTVGIPATSVNPSSLKSYTIPNGCGSGEFRPWALSEYQGNIYVGTVCSGETSQNFNDLKAIVYSLNPTSGVFTEVFQFPLTYTKGVSDITQNCPQYDKWNPWTNTFPQGCATTYDVGRGKTVNFVMYPQPILSGIGFDSDGSMILGLMDRFGLWAGYRNYAPIDDGTLYDGFVGGDLLRAQFNASTKSYTLESNATSGDLTGCGVNNGEGPGGGEFFCNDTWHFYGNPAHNEITNGAVLILPIDGSIISSAMDPVDEIYQSGGLRTYNRTNGDLKYGYALYSDVPGTLGKSGGTGDIKASCGPAPIEIGNRVWKDLDFDGIQDPEELGISGVTVELFDITAGNILVGSTTTNTTGNYSFNSLNVVGGLKYENQYEIKIDISQSSLTSLGSIDISPSNAISGALSDLIDSDGLLSGTFTKASVTTGYAGETNYSFDFGITTCNPYLPTVVVTQPSCVKPNGKIEITNPSGSSYTFSIDGNNFLPISIFDNLIPDTYKVLVKDNFGCISDTVKVLLNPAPPIPSKPILIIIQPSCQMSTGMISVSSPVGSGMTYSLDGTNFNNTTGVFNGLGQNTYTVWAKNNEGCVSDSTKGNINPQPSTPIKPVLTTVQPTCTIATGKITVSAPTGVGMSYSIDGISFTNTTGIFNNLAAGNYTVWVKNNSGCISDTSKAVILPQPNSPTKPILATIQPTCTVATGKITVSAPTGVGMSYSLDGLSFTNTTGIFNNLAAGNYTVWVKNNSGCISDTSKAVILPQPNSPTKPILATIQPTCTVA
ncbi:hypothetical protein EGI22_13185, partial [Lacihabitans sp. LS3-19]|uniref:SdrD B-like domain-containing protein n=1 Tax=Lacihabitans sp. LS3-19 TaxID=2487335 RepID=UPI0020CF0091